MRDVVGWTASAVLVATLTWQVWTQWRTRSVEGVSAWLYYGQLGASSGFMAYSWMLGNWVYVVANALGLLSAIAGVFIYHRNARRAAKRDDA